jgi:hypothetical protein
VNPDCFFHIVVAVPICKLKKMMGITRPGKAF